MLEIPLGRFRGDMLHRLKALSPLWTSTISIAFWIFVTIHPATVVYVRHVTYCDPGSWLFNPALAYTPKVLGSSPIASR